MFTHRRRQVSGRILGDVGHSATAQLRFATCWGWDDCHDLPGHLVAPTNRKWASSPQWLMWINPTYPIYPIYNWGELTHLRAVGWATKHGPRFSAFLWAFGFVLAYKCLDIQKWDYSQWLSMTFPIDYHDWEPLRFIDSGWNRGNYQSIGVSQGPPSDPGSVCFLVVELCWVPKFQRSTGLEPFTYMKNS